MAQKNDRKWKRILIYPRFQLTMIITNIVLLLVTITAIGVQINRSFAHLREVGVSVGLPATHPYFNFINYQSDMIHNYLLYACVISVLLSIFIMFYFSHRVAGPVVRLISYFKGIRETGENSELKFRDNDYFSELPAEINGALEKIKVGK